MKTFKVLNAILLSVIILCVVPIHFMAFLEKRPVEIPDVDFGDEIPEDYYEGACPVDYLRLGGDAEVWLDGLRWADPYVPNEWDCSTQSTFLEWALECCGHETDILIDQSHAWLMIDLGGEWRYYEPVFGIFMSRGMTSLFKGYWRFHDLYELHDFFKWRWEKYPDRWEDSDSEDFDEWFAGEWLWWRLE